MTNSLSDRACIAAEEGMYVFPVRVAPDPERPGKHLKQPLIAWTTHSSNDPETVEAMPWQNATHFGIDCEMSGIWVVDIDELGALARCPLRSTRMQETISGGMHYIYRASPRFDQRNGTGVPVEGMDIRANGGFIVWYGLGEMVDDTIQPWPFSEPIGKQRGTRHSGDGFIPGDVRAGGRNNDAIAAAGYFMAKHPTATFDLVLAYLVGHSALHHKPPLSQSEIHKVAASAMRWRAEESDVKPEEFFGSMRDLPRASPPEKLCGDWMRAGSLSMVFARAGVGKTAFLAELAMALYTGTEFLGMPCRKSPRILWINGDLPIWQLEERIGYLSECVTLWHIMFDDLMLRQDELFRKAQGYDAVIMDNRPALFDLGDANAAEQWKPLMNLLRQICNSGPAVILATHEGKGEGNTSSFGSSAQEWQLDNNIRISNRSPSAAKEVEYIEKCNGKIPARKVVWHKHRLSAQPPDREFYLHPVMFADGIAGPRLVLEWKCFYSADGRPLVKPEKST